MMMNLKQPMKKILTTLILLATLLTGSYAQGRYGDNEVSLSYGQLTTGQGLYVFVDVFAVIFSLGNFNPGTPFSTGEVILSYNKYVNDTFGVGLSASYEYMGGIRKDASEDETANLNLNFISLMPTMNISWFNYPHVGMYSKIGLGATLMTTPSETNLLPSFQLNPICCDFGNDSWRGFIELGLGTQGVVQLGVKHVF